MSNDVYYYCRWQGLERDGVSNNNNNNDVNAMLHDCNANVVFNNTRMVSN